MMRTQLLFLKTIAVLFLVSVLPCFNSIRAQALSRGDLAVIGWNALTDKVHLVTLVDIGAGTEIKITDRGWDRSTNAFTASLTGDGIVTWIVPGTIAAGQQDNAQYTGPTTAADRDTWLGRITDISNWTGSNADDIMNPVTSATTPKVNVVMPEITPGESNILYVDINVNTAAPGYTGTGDSWVNAVPQLADALKWAREQYDGGSPGWSGADPLRIYVAVGTYLPAYHAADGLYTTDGDRHNAFVLVADVQLYGGFDPASGVGTLEDERILPDVGTPGLGTVLSGDLDGNDHDGDFEGHLENTYHVVIAGGPAGTALLDGFTITAGAHGGKDEAFTVYNEPLNPLLGAGMLALSSSPSLTDCLLSKNLGYMGGGMANFSAASSPQLTRCTFHGNSAEHGGGVMNFGASPVFTDCMFLENSAALHGGGMVNIDGSTTVTGSTFRKNTADSGGGMRNDMSAPTLNQCNFSENTAQNGGAVMNTSVTLSMTGCTFTQNSAGQKGGGILSESCPVISLTNSVLSENTAGQGAAMMSSACESVTLTNCTVSGNTASVEGSGLVNFQGPVSLANVIIWGNEADGDMTAPEASVYHIGEDLPVISHSLIANWGGSDNWDNSLGTDGGGNIDTDPLFVDPAAGDYHLQTCSPAINKGDNTALPGGVTEDAGGDPRAVHTVVDMGAFEYQEALPPGNLALGNDESTRTINGPTDFFGNGESCRLIARVAPTGTGPVSGSVTARVEIDPEVAFHNGSPYVQRHYLINAPEGGSATVTLYFTQAEFDDFNDELPGGHLPAGPSDNNNKSNLRIYQFHGTSGSTPGDYQGAPLTVIAPEDEDIQWDAVNERWEVSFGVEGFSGFFVGSESSPLPVRLVSFSGLPDAENTVGLYWEVAEQQDIAAYTVEYSPTGLAFEEAGTVAATRAAEARYTFRHTPLRGKGTAYYRLRTVEADGAQSISRIISVKLPDRSVASVYPVPADHGFWLEGEGVAGTAGLLVNVYGVVFRTWTFSADKQYIDISPLPSGLYFVRLHDGTSLKVVRK